MKSAKPTPAPAAAPVATPKMPTLSLQEKAFDINSYTDVLPVRYQGVGGKDLVTALESLKKASTKDEFETNDQFQARLANIASKPLLRSIRPNDTLALAVQAPMLKRSYDADSGTMTIELSTAETLNTVMEPRGFKIPRGMQIITTSRESTTEDAVFTNAYGASVNGKSYMDQDVQAIIPIYAPSSIKFSMQPSDAKALKEQPLAVLLVGTLNSMQVVESGLHLKPTLDDPIDLFRHMRSIQFQPVQAWVYLPETGKVLNKTIIEAPPLAKAGIDLVQEKIDDYMRLSILAPCAFKSETIGGWPNTQTKIFTAQPPSARVRVVFTKVISSPQSKVIINLEDQLTSYIKGMEKEKAQFKEKTVTGDNVLGLPAKILKGTMSQNGINYAIRSAAYLETYKNSDPSLCMIHIAVDLSLDQAENEANRIFQSFAESRY